VPTYCSPIPQTSRKESVALQPAARGSRLSTGRRKRSYWLKETSFGSWLLGMQNIDDDLLERGRQGQELT
jgi:hypothetical protein